MDNFNLKKYLAEGRLLKENQDDLFIKAGFNFDDGLLGGVGSGGGGYYDHISDKISGYNLDKFDEEEFNNWYDNFSKESFNNNTYTQEEMREEGIDSLKLPKGIHQLGNDTEAYGAGEVRDDKVVIYSYPSLSDDMGTEFLRIFSLSKDGRIIPKLSKEEVKAKLASNEYAII
tara:strand:+ start:416 stop:934 length:519 start_codon:yes stop_codon:yes gene_type:complete